MGLRRTFLIMLASIVAPVLYSQDTSQSDAVYLKLKKEYTLHADGSFDYHFHKELKLLTYFSFQRLFGETFITYNPEFQDLKINECYTIMSDGKKITAPENAFNEVLPHFAENAAAFNQLREMVVTHTGLERNAVIHLDYTISSRPGYMPYMMGNETIGENMPVKEMEVIVRVPSSNPILYKTVGVTAAPDIVTMESQVSYIWSFRELESLPMGNFTDEGRQPKILFSSAKDFQWAYFTFVNQPAFRELLPGELAKKSDALSQENKDDMEIMLALQDLVIGNLELKDIPLEYTGFKIRTPGECWESTYATPLEKAVLLSDMLVRSGINAVPVGLVHKEYFDRGLGNLSVFDQFMVQVNPRKYPRIYLSVESKNDQNLLYGLGDYIVVMLDAAAESVKTFEEKPIKNLLELTGSLTLDDSGLVSGDLDQVLRGINNPYLKLLRDNNSIKNYLHNGLSIGDIKSFSMETLTSEVSEAGLHIARKEPAISYGGYIFFELPGLSTGIDSWSLGLLDETREAPIKLPYPVTEKYAFNITVPGNFRLESPQNPIEIRNPVGEVILQIKVKDGLIEMEKEISLGKEPIGPDEYPYLLELVHAWNLEYLNRLVFTSAR